MIAKTFLFSLVISLLTFLFFFSSTLARGGDFVSYYTGSSILRDGKANELYNLNLQKKYQKDLDVHFYGRLLLPFRSLPFVTLLFLPLTYFSYLNGYIIFSVFNIALLLLFIFTAKKTFLNLKNSVVFSLLTFTYLPNIHTLLIGQTSIILSFIFLTIYISFKQEKNLPAGIISGLILLKPQFIIVLPFFLLLSSKKRKYIIGLFISLSLLFLINVAISGWSWLAQYPAFTLLTESSLYGSYFWHPYTFTTVVDLLLGISSSTNLLIFGLNTFFYFTFLIYFITLANKKSFEINFTLALLAMILFSVHALSHDLTILLAPIFILLDQACVVRGMQKRIRLFISTILYVLMLFLVIPEIFLGRFNFGCFFLLLILFLLIRLSKSTVSHQHQSQI